VPVGDPAPPDDVLPELLSDDPQATAAQTDAAQMNFVMPR
jgi:hypothetical protein